MTLITRINVYRCSPPRRIDTPSLPSLACAQAALSQTASDGRVTSSCTSFTSCRDYVFSEVLNPSVNWRADVISPNIWQYIQTSQVNGLSAVLIRGGKVKSTTPLQKRHLETLAWEISHIEGIKAFKSGISFLDRWPTCLELSQVHPLQTHFTHKFPIP